VHRLLRAHALPVAALVVLVAADFALGPRHTVLGLFAIPPLVAATLVRRRATAAYAVLALVAAGLLGIYDRQYTGESLVAQVVRLCGVALAGVLGLVGATRRLHRDRELAAAVDEAAGARDAVALVTRLQRSLLTDPPPVAGLEVAVRYSPAVQQAQVGGDWYDVFPLPDGGTALVIGDVAGHDVAAAATMAEARGVLRGIASSVDGSPAAVLAALDRVLERLGDHTLITAVVATLHADPVGARLCWASAGHPPPLLLRADGGVRVLDDAPDLLLGVDATSERHDREVLLHHGDALLLYTDGLVERRDVPVDDGVTWLAGWLAAFAGRPLAELADALLADTAEQRGDDVAVLAVRVSG
jgi:phosphoserine phosphatase RsbU/P